MSDLPTLLPRNAEAVELALEQFFGRLQGAADPISTLWDAERCPENLLGYLAWAFSVEVWDSSWPEQQRRQVLVDAVSVHRRKGSIGSVRKALSSIGFATSITEWFEYGGDPHTFRIDAFGEDVFNAGQQISPELVALVADLIENVKPVRSHYTLRVGEKREAAVSIASGAPHTMRDCRVIRPPLPVHEHIATTPLGSGQRATFRSCQTHTFDMGDAA